MLTDKDIRDIEGYLKGLLPPHREERFRERLNREPELKAEFEALSPMLNALEEIKIENKVREIITTQIPENNPVTQEIVITQKIVPLYRRMWVYVAAACVLVLVVVGIDYRNNQKLREELLVLEQREKAREDSLKRVYAQQKQPQRDKDSTNLDSPKENIIVKENDGIKKSQSVDNQINIPKNEKVIANEKVPKNIGIEHRNNLEEEENENPDISSLNARNHFTKTTNIKYMYPFFKTRGFNEIMKGTVNVRLSKNTFGTSNQIGSVVFMEQTNTFNLTIFDKEILNVLQKNDITIKQQSDEYFLLDFGNRHLYMNIKTRVVK
jgi:hypothetical protein